MVAGSVTPAFLKDITEFCGDDLIADAPLAYLQEPRGQMSGTGSKVARPRSTQNVMDIMRIAHAHNVAVVPYGGGTGLVGGQVMPASQGVKDPLILSLEKMNRIRAISAEENVMYVEAGAILADVKTAAAEIDRFFPLSLASEGSCRIGGNLATNAGGVNTVRYGNARDLCLGVEAVLADGTLHQGLSCLRKDNRGYDFTNILLGSEGTLGVITAAALRLFPQPRERATAFVQVASPSSAISFFNQLQSDTGGMVSAFELVSRTSFDFLRAEMPLIRLPFDQETPWMVLAEVDGGEDSSVDVQLTETLGWAMEEGHVLDANIAQSDGQSAEFWAVRETIPEANRKVGAICSHDISVPITAIPAFIDAGQSAISAAGDFRINCFGHVGDGNLHFNIFPPIGKTKQEYAQYAPSLSETVYKLVDQFDGSFSAEHGIGRLKLAELKTYTDPAKYAFMQSTKRALDPKGILNPGAILPVGS